MTPKEPDDPRVDSAVNVIKDGGPHHVDGVGPQQAHVVAGCGASRMLDSAIRRGAAEVVGAPARR